MLRKATDVSPLTHSAMSTSPQLGDRGATAQVAICSACSRPVTADAFFCHWCRAYLPVAGLGSRPGLFRRWAALVLDPLIFVALWLAATLIVAPISSSLAVICAVVFPLAWFIRYLVALSHGETPGKRALGLRVVRESTGARPGFGTMFIREVFGRFLSGLVFGLGYFWALFDKNGQGWHDKLAGTVVIRAARQEPASAYASSEQRPHREPAADQTGVEVVPPQHGQIASIEHDAGLPPQQPRPQDVTPRNDDSLARSLAISKDKPVAAWKSPIALLIAAALVFVAGWAIATRKATTESSHVVLTETSRPMQSIIPRQESPVASPAPSVASFSGRGGRVATEAPVSRAPADAQRAPYRKDPATCSAPGTGSTITVELAAGGEDTFVGDRYATRGDPGSGVLNFGGWGDNYYDYLRFAPPRSSLARLRSATLCLFATKISPNDPALVIGKFTDRRDLRSITITSRPSDQMIGDFGRVDAGWNAFDASALVDDWEAGRSTTIGIVLTPTQNNQANGAFASSRYPNVALRPRLILDP
jgi:uncharacterized RDD family membrane protein YckC